MADPETEELLYGCWEQEEWMSTTTEDNSLVLMERIFPILKGFTIDEVKLSFNKIISCIGRNQPIGISWRSHPTEK
jgi:hypothetical protein